MPGRDCSGGLSQWEEHGSRASHGGFNGRVGIDTSALTEFGMSISLYTVGKETNSHNNIIHCISYYTISQLLQYKMMHGVYSNVHAIWYT